MSEKDLKPKSRIGSIRNWFLSHKKFAIGVFALMLLAPVSTALVMHWETGIPLKVTGNSATIGIGTFITGISTNANQTPIYLSGSSTPYNLSNIDQYTAQTNTHRTGNSTFSLAISDLLPGDYVSFSVTVKNLGGSTLAFGNYTMNDAAYNSTTGAYIPPSENVTGSMNATNSSYTPIAQDTYWGNFGNLYGYTAEQFASSLSGHSYWAFDWGSNSKVIPKELKPGQSFTYTIYVGLGSTASYPPTQAVFTLSIPLIPAQ